MRPIPNDVNDDDPCRYRFFTIRDAALITSWFDSDSDKDKISLIASEVCKQLAVKESATPFLGALIEFLTVDKREEGVMLSTIEEVSELCELQIADQLTKLKNQYYPEHPLCKRRPGLYSLYVGLNEHLKPVVQAYLPRLVKLLRTKSDYSVAFHTRLLYHYYSNMDLEQQESVRSFILRYIKAEPSVKSEDDDGDPPQPAIIEETGRRSSAWNMTLRAWVYYGALRANRRIVGYGMTDVDVRYIRMKEILTTPTKNNLMAMFEALRYSQHVCAVNAQSLGSSFDTEVLYMLGESLVSSPNLFALNLGECERHMTDEIWEHFADRYLANSNISFIYMSEHIFQDRNQMKEKVKDIVRKNRTKPSNPKLWQYVEEYGDLVLEIGSMWFNPRNTGLFRRAWNQHQHEQSLKIMTDASEFKLERDAV